MSDNNTEFDPLGDDADFEDFDSNSQSMGDLLRNNPMVKIGVVMGAIATIVGGIVLFGGEKEVQTPSVIRGGSDVREAPGASDVSESYRRQIEDFNKAQQEMAERTGGSSLPVPVGASRNRLVDDVTRNTNEQDPLERWRRLQEERQEREKPAAPAPVQAPPPAPVEDPYAADKANLAAAMAGHMESILSQHGPKPSQLMNVTSAAFFANQREADAQRLGGIDGGFGGAPAPVAPAVLLPAGVVEYGQLMTEANTDAPGPVLAQIVSGPLAGSRILGSFKASDHFITLQFNTVVVDGVAYGANAIALDPATANPGMITEIDRRYFTRVILPAAAAFVEGMGSAIAQTGSTTLTVGTTGSSSSTTTSNLDTKQEFFKAVEEAAGKVGDILDQEASRTRPMLRVAAGTPMAILFVQPVTQTSTVGGQGAGSAAGGFGGPVGGGFGGAMGAGSGMAMPRSGSTGFMDGTIESGGERLRGISAALASDIAN